MQKYVDYHAYINIAPLCWTQQLHSKHCCKGLRRVSGKFIEFPLTMDSSLWTVTMQQSMEEQCM